MLTKVRLSDTSPWRLTVRLYFCHNEMRNSTSQIYDNRICIGIYKLFEKKTKQPVKLDNLICLNQRFEVIREFEFENDSV